MTHRILMIGSLVFCTALAASSAVSPPRLGALRARAVPGSSHLFVSGTRSAAQRPSATAAKMDSMLADLSRHAGRARTGHVLADLHAMIPAARFKLSAAGAPLVSVDAITRGSVEQLKAALVGLGLEHAAVYANDVGGWLPVDALEAAAARTEVTAVRAAMSRTRTGAVTSQGDFVQRSDVVRTQYPSLTGTGVTVGVLSDSFNCYAVYAEPNSGVPASGNAGYAYNGFTADYATDISTGDLPANVDVIEEPNCLDGYGAPTQLPFSDEGRAMLQIVHDVAPGANLAFRTGDNNEADFAAGIGDVAAAGAKVIADDLGYFDEPFYQDGLIAQAVNAVEAQGVAYFSAAGNDGNLSFESTAPNFGTLSNGTSNAGEYLLNFAPPGSAVATALPVSVPAIPPGDFLAIVVEWDQPYVTGSPKSGGATSAIDVCITGGTGSDTITDYDGNSTSCSGPTTLGHDPVAIVIVGNPANAAGNSQPQNFNIVVGLAGGTPAPGRVIVSVEDDGLGSAITSYATNSATIQGHAGSAGAAAVGAAFYYDTPRCGTTPVSLESFSSQGGAPILFDIAGNRLATPVVRQKPDFVGPDGVNNTFLGFTLASDAAGGFPADGVLPTTITACQNVPAYPNFFGTSAATPHAASIAALILQAAPAATPTEIYAAMRSTALAMGGATPNFISGYGYIQADAAVGQFALTQPTLTLGATSVVAGSSTTITWSAPYATGCTASGSWSGALAASGTQTLTPAAAGVTTYGLSCANPLGAAAASSVSLTATASSGGSRGGGGALGALMLCGLAGLSAARWVRVSGHVPRRARRN